MNVQKRQQMAACPEVVPEIKKCGFSLIEVTLALGIVSFVLISLFGLLSVGMRSNQDSTRYTIVPQIVDQMIAKAKAGRQLVAGFSTNCAFTEAGWETTVPEERVYDAMLTSESFQDQDASGKLQLLKVNVKWPGGSNVFYATSVVD